jgi:hypothetical protein
MRFEFSAGLACAGLIFGLIGCSSTSVKSRAAPPPPTPSGGAPLLAEPEIEPARALYSAKCARCHKFHNPAKYTETEWQEWMRKMSRKAKLKPEQEALLSRYLGMFRDLGTNVTIQSNHETPYAAEPHP